MERLEGIQMIPSALIFSLEGRCPLSQVLHCKRFNFSFCKCVDFAHLLHNHQLRPRYIIVVFYSTHVWSVSLLKYVPAFCCSTISPHFAVIFVHVLPPATVLSSVFALRSAGKLAQEVHSRYIKYRNQHFSKDHSLQNGDQRL